MTSLIADRLRARARTAGSLPLLTYYDTGAGDRTELSAVTLMNWVDKTSNLLVDEYLLDAGDVVELAVAERSPGHWMTACWELACWQVGVVVSVASGLQGRLVVTGPEWDSYLGSGTDVLACSLHPLGLGFGEPLPDGVADYALEVRSQPDSHVAVPQSGLAIAWAESGRQLTQADLITSVTGSAERRLVRPASAWTTARAGVITALVTGGSVVVVVGDHADQIARIAATEQAVIS